MKLILYLIFCFKDIYLLFVIIKLFTMEFVFFSFLHSLDKVKCMYRNAQVGKRAVATDYRDKSYLRTDATYSNTGKTQFYVYIHNSRY